MPSPRKIHCFLRAGGKRQLSGGHCRRWDYHRKKGRILHFFSLLRRPRSPRDFISFNETNPVIHFFFATVLATREQRGGFAALGPLL